MNHMYTSSIRKISIKNFRGIDSLDFSPKNLNIIVGPNNTGKSSLIKAIRLLMSSLQEFRNVDPNSLHPINHLIFESNENFGVIKIDIEKKNKKLTNFRLEFKYGEQIPKNFIKFAQFEKFENLRIKRLINQATEEFKTDKSYLALGDDPSLISSRYLVSNGSEKYLDDKIEEVTNEIIQANKDSGLSTIFFKLFNDDKVILESYIGNPPRYSRSRRYRKPVFRNYYKQNELFDSIPKKINTNFLFQEPLQKIDLAQYFKKFTKLPIFYDILENIKQKLNYIYDLREADGEINVVVKSSEGRKIFIPLNLMGDGFQSLIASYILFELHKEGIILIEEPENSLHPGYMELLAETIVSKCGIQQYFFSTHSLELIKKILDYAKKTDYLEKVIVLRLSRQINKIDREILMSDEIFDELENLKIDLRGY